MRVLIVVMVGWTLAMGAGCGDGSSNTAPPGGTARATVHDTDLAVPADYEDKVDGEITSDNYRAQLDKAEAEIAK